MAYKLIITGSGLSVPEASFRSEFDAKQMRQRMHQWLVQDGYREMKRTPGLYKKGRAHWRRLEVQNPEGETI